MGGRRPAASTQGSLTDSTAAAELHKIGLLTSSWPHRHFPKAFYFSQSFYFASQGLEKTSLRVAPESVWLLGTSWSRCPLELLPRAQLFLPRQLRPRSP